MTAPGPLRGLLRPRVTALFALIVLLLAAGIWVAFTHSTANATNGDGDRPGTGGSSPSAQPLRVISITPATGSKQVNGAAPVKIQFSAAVSQDSPLPVIRPRIRGVWHGIGTDTLQFFPRRGFREWTRVRVHVPSGMKSVNGGQLATGQQARFVVGHYQSARMAELLAQLGYLPLTWQPATGSTPAPLTDARAQVSAAFQPPAGSFAWKRGYPHILRTFWKGGSPSGLIMDGAIRAFESDHGMTMDGVAGQHVWNAVFTALARGEHNQHGYSYALASEKEPETLTVWHNGHVVMHTLANTGIPAAPTTIGTAPVYLRYVFQIMRGKNPDGTKYADPVKWVSYFRSGEAVHYFPRGSYGFPQSLGCVELPLPQAKAVWPYLTYGTLVTVAAP